MMGVSILKQLMSALLLLVIFSSSSYAQDKETADQVQVKEQTASLVINNKRLVTFYSSLDGLSPNERVERASIVMNGLARVPDFNVNAIHAVDGLSGTDIVVGDERIATITEKDAAHANGNTKLVANDFILKAKYALIKSGEKTDAPSMAIAIAFCIVGFLTVVLLVAFLSKLAISACDMLKNMRDSRKLSVRIQDAELMSSDSTVELLVAAVKLIQFSLICAAFTAYILISLTFFPHTRPISDALIESARIPLVSMAESVLHYLPKLFTIAVIGLLTYASMFVARFFFNALRDRSIRIADFDPEWAEPTYKLARFALIFFGLVCMLPYLPGWDTPAFKQVGLVVGLLLSFGSTSSVGNMMAGVVLTYTNAFRIGDRVKVAEHIGDVTERTLFVTRLKTPKGEVISIPNAPILAAPITNYSAEGRQGRLILHRSVAISYDLPWRRVQEALLEAARATKNVLADPAPFVLQSSLDDNFVTYEINVYTDRPEEMLNIYSDLHANIQDAFHKAGMEIMSPNYISLRDGNKHAIPDEYLPKNYESPSFKVSAKS